MFCKLYAPCHVLVEEEIEIAYLFLNPSIFMRYIRWIHAIITLVLYFERRSNNTSRHIIWTSSCMRRIHFIHSSYTLDFIRRVCISVFLFVNKWLFFHLDLIQCALNIEKKIANLFFLANLLFVANLLLLVFSFSLF